MLFLSMPVMAPQATEPSFPRLYGRLLCLGVATMVFITPQWEKRLNSIRVSLAGFAVIEVLGWFTLMWASVKAPWAPLVFGFP